MLYTLGKSVALRPLKVGVFEGDNDSWGGRSQRKQALMRNKSSLPGLSSVHHYPLPCVDIRLSVPPSHSQSQSSLQHTLQYPCVQPTSLCAFVCVCVCVCVYACVCACVYVLCTRVWVTTYLLGSDVMCKGTNSFHLTKAEQLKAEALTRRMLPLPGSAWTPSPPRKTPVPHLSRSWPRGSSVDSLAR